LDRFADQGRLRGIPYPVPVSTVSKIFAFLLLAVVGVILFFVLSPENFAPLSAAVPSTAPQPTIADAAQPATVNYVHDGDTLFLDTPSDSNLKVRLLAVDTPEVGDDAECFGDEARAYLREQLPEGSSVFTLTDTNETDQYGRALLFVWTSGGTFINLNLVASGYAEAVFIGDNRLYQAEFEAAEDAAQEASLGRWGTC